jgi:hypothetical protein
MGARELAPGHSPPFKALDLVGATTGSPALVAIIRRTGWANVFRCVAEVDTVLGQWAVIAGAPCVG